MEVEAAEQASKAQGKLLVQKLEPAETTLEVDVKAVEQGSRNLVVDLTSGESPQPRRESPRTKTIPGQTTVV